MGINHVVLQGNLTKDPECKYAPSGSAILDFCIASNRKYKSGEEMKEEVSFIGVNAFGKTAEMITEFFKKGSPIIVEGRIKTDRWTDKEGKQQSKTKIVADRFHFCGGKKEDEQSDEANSETTAWGKDDQTN